MNNTAFSPNDMAVWPENQPVDLLSENPSIFVTRFTDTKHYHERLKQRILELESDPGMTHRMPIGGSKIGNVSGWGIAEADFINQRAKTFFAKGIDSDNIKIDLSWASVSRHGEYLGPHSHDQSLGSVVYCLDIGENDPERPLSGNLAFVDPRIEGCCDRQEDCATFEVTPDMQAGTMVLFPSAMMHYVHPYTGHRPRITLSWNLIRT